MKFVLKDCYLEMGSVPTEVGGKDEEMPRPKVIVVKGRMAHRYEPDKSVPVEALLDTGNDVTVVKPEKFNDLEASLGYRLPVKRKIKYYGHEPLQPTFDLAFIFPGDHAYYSKYGFIVPGRWDFDVGDVWLGQDIFSQLIVTFDGVSETVTISDAEA